jgi:hypothetical protein
MNESTNKEKLTLKEMYPGEPEWKKSKVGETVSTLDDEFNKAFMDMEDVDPVCMKQSQEIVMEEHECVVETVETHELPAHGQRTQPSRVQLTRARKAQTKVEQLPMIGGEYGMYACDRPVCVELWRARGQDKVKPWWAVDALVRFRDQGVCQVCGETCGRHAEVVRKMPSVVRGEFNEYNCVLVCKNCADVWPKKNFYTHQSELWDMYRLYYCVLKRRAFGKKGAVPLSIKGMSRYREVCHKMEDSQIQLEVELEQQRQIVGKAIVKKKLTEEEEMKLLHEFGIAKDRKVSEHEAGVSVDDDGTVWRTVE